MLSLLDLCIDKSSSDLPNQHYWKLTQHIKKNTNTENQEDAVSYSGQCKEEWKWELEG